MITHFGNADALSIDLDHSVLTRRIALQIDNVPLLKQLLLLLDLTALDGCLSPFPTPIGPYLASHACGSDTCDVQCVLKLVLDVQPSRVLVNGASAC